MVFSSITFMFFFLPAVTLLYFVVPSLKAKNVLLLIASLLFYTWGEPRYIAVMLLSIGMNYAFGLMVSKDKRYKKAVLFIAVVANLSMLFIFKYLGLTTKIVNKVLGLGIAIPDIVLPIGISFYTFQAMSYVIDVYRDPILVQKNPLHLGLYIAFFPQLVAGPIVRYSDIKAQIEHRVHSIENFACGMERLIMGLAKKVLIANAVAQCVDNIYCLDPARYSPIYAWIAAIAYTLQIYYDFSGYSDMAIGLGRMFGFHFRENFRHPYQASDIRDFWRRWHISLYSWFRDYLYIPLGGNRKGKYRTMLNKCIVFALTGLWHGATVNFVVWGLGHGTLMMIEDALRRRYKSIEARLQGNAKTITHKSIKVIYRLAALLAVVLLWVVFRNVNWKDGIKVLFNMFGLLHAGAMMSNRSLNLFVMDWRIIAPMAVGIILSVSWKEIFDKCGLTERMTGVSAIRVCAPFIKCAVLVLLLIASSAALMYGAYNPFIYFRF